MKWASSNDPATIHRKLRMPSARTLARFLREAQAAVRLRGQVSVLLTTDKEIRRLNRQFRRKNKATDVLSFPAPEALSGDVAGDLAISVPTARLQAMEQGHALAVEIKVLMLHGLLHLAGFDHEADAGQMARRERLLRERLRLPLGLIERSGIPTLAAGASAVRSKKQKRVLRAPQDDKRKHSPQDDVARMEHPGQDDSKRGGRVGPGRERRA